MDPFIGEIVLFGGNFAPRGWAFCEGQLLAISQNTALFSILGTTYGGDGRTSFGLPDLRGRAAVHPGNGPGLSSRRLGEKGGSEMNTLTTNQMPSHTHVMTGSSNPADQTTAASGFLPSNGRGEPSLYASAAGTPATMGNNIGNTGGGQQVNNMQPYLAVNYIIALQGVFPSRS